MLNSDVTVILADGEFPSHPTALNILRFCSRVICCDGAAAKLVASGIRNPDFVVGDLDSIDQNLVEELNGKVVHFETQDTNDLTKAFEFAIDSGYQDIVILGATGLREDHTLGNISLLMNYAERANVRMYTNYGFFVALRSSSRIESEKGQQVSVFSFTPDMPISYQGLKWDITNRPLKMWWEGTLNESLGDYFTIEFENAKVVVYLAYMDVKK